jgi:uncharacterized protein (DUF2126 family)
MGQGKWYPGEQLPRWALSIFWRADGEPCWHNPALLADERDAAKYDAEDAQRFTQALARKLGLSTQYITPGYEDTWYFLWRERRLPVNVDPFDAKLDDELERARLRRVFTQGLDATVGYVLPLQADGAGPLSSNGKSAYHRVSGTHWSTGPWFFRDERMYLVPGDSPMGYRLPLDSLPWVSAADYPYHIEQDPHTARDALPQGSTVNICVATRWAVVLPKGACPCRAWTLMPPAQPSTACVLASPARAPRPPRRCRRSSRSAMSRPPG